MPTAKNRISRTTRRRKIARPTALPITPEARELLEMAAERERLYAAALSIPSIGGPDSEDYPPAKRAAFAKWRHASDRSWARAGRIGQQLLQKSYCTRDIAALLLVAFEIPQLRHEAIDAVLAVTGIREARIA